MIDRMQHLAEVGQALQLSMARRAFSPKVRARLASGQSVYAGTWDDVWFVPFAAMGLLKYDGPVTSDYARVKATPAGLEYFGKADDLEMPQ